MALTKCKECGHEISKSAKVCPSCGAVIKRTGLVTKLVAVFFAFVLLSWIVGSCQSYNDSAKRVEERKAAPAPAAPEASQPAEPSTGNAAHDQLVKLSDAERNAMFGKLLAASGEKCGKVKRNFFQGIGAEGAFWNVACSDGSAYAIQVNADASGSTNVLDCGVLKAVGGSECFKKF